MGKDIRPYKTRKRIKESLLQLMNEKDVADITICELTERAKTSRKTFYLHYNNIGEVLQEIEKDMADLMVESMSMEKSIVFKVRLVNFINNMVEKINSDFDYYSLVASSSYAKIIFNNIDNIVREELLLAMDKETKLDSIHKECLLDFIIGGIINTILNWAKAPDGPSVDIISSIIFEILNNNLSCYLENYDMVLCDFMLEKNKKEQK